MIVKYLILSDGARENQRDLAQLQLSWGGDVPLGDIVYLKGAGCLHGLSADGVLRVDAPSDYPSILAKTKAGILYMYKETSFDYLVRVNASTYVNHCSLLRILRKKNIEFGGYPLSKGSLWSRNPKSEFFLSGAFLLFSRKTCQLFEDLEIDSYTGCPDDVAISSFLLEKKIKASKISRSNLSNSFLFVPKVHVRLKSSYVGTAASSRFPLVHSFYKEVGALKKLKSWFSIQSNEIRILKESPVKTLGLFTWHFVRIKGELSFWIYRVKNFLVSRRKPS